MAEYRGVAFSSKLWGLRIFECSFYMIGGLGERSPAAANPNSTNADTDIISCHMSALTS